MKEVWNELSIVTSCVHYGKYLYEWTKAILNSTVLPGRVCIFTHGTEDDRTAAVTARKHFMQHGVEVVIAHLAEQVDFGKARNLAVAMANSPWVMHLDADDLLMAHAIAEFRTIAPTADVIQAGYERSGNIAAGPARRARLYHGADGLKALDLPAICSGCSPFRRSLWEQTPYRTDMLGAWDTALWIGFARLHARFRPTTRASFYYRQHQDSVFNSRRRVNGWSRAHTSAMLKSLRRDYQGVDLLVPVSRRLSPERQRNWSYVKAHYAAHHPDINIIEGIWDSDPWIKGRAIEDALGSSRGRVIIISDADCLPDPGALRSCIDKVDSGEVAWAMPHDLVLRTNEALSAVICRQDVSQLPIMPAAVQCDRPPHAPAKAGGVFVMKRVDYDACGGIPQVFEGWGSEDKAFGVIADTLLGPCFQQLQTPLLHLWHQHQQEKVLPNKNLGMLAKIGHAALHGKDSLIALVSTFPNGSARPLSALRPAPGLYKKKAVREVRQFDQRTIAERREALQAKRRRVK